MTAVKGSRQHQMIVVTHRPWYRAGVFTVCLSVIGIFSWLTYHYGLDQGLATKVAVVVERDSLRSALGLSEGNLAGLRQQVADLKLGGQVDTRANEEVRQAVEALQTQIAELNEEIRFYKGVMVPNADAKGLRVERLDLRPTGATNRYRYSVMLTQIVDKHEYIKGVVEVSLIGTQSGEPRTYRLNELDTEISDEIRFRFRYFQNIEGELTLPAEFLPTDMVIAARPSGRDAKGIEKTFVWQVKEV
jgi:ribosomal protein S13